MWEEPLSTSIADLDQHHFEARVHANAAPQPLARVRCSINRDTRCAMYGEMQIDDKNGAPRQVERAMVLMVRAALQHAQQNGVTVGVAEVPDRMVAFTQRISGMLGAPISKDDDRRLFIGELAEMRSAALDRTDADGNFRS